MDFRKLFFVLLLFVALPSFSQTAVFNAPCKKAFDHISALEFEKATQLLEAQKRENPGNTVNYFLEDFMAFLKVFISEEEVLYEQALDKRKEWLANIEELPEDNPYRSYMKGEIYLHWASVRGKMGDRFLAALELNKAYRLLRNNQQNHPGFVPGKAGMGVIEVLIGTIPDKYNWVKTLLNLEGTVKGGRARIAKILEKASADTAYAYLEQPTLFMLSFIELNTRRNIDEALMQRYQKLDSANMLANEPLMIFSYANLLQKKQANEQTLRILSYYSESKQRYPFYYLDYMKGLAYLYKNSHRCIPFFNRYLDRFKGRHYIKSSYQKMAWYYLLNGDTIRYRNYIHYAAQKGYAVVGADKSAMKEAEEKTIPNVALLKARLFFDGGYFNDSMEALEGFQKKGASRRQITEWYYRRGRVLHETGKYREALSHYDTAFHRGRELDAYFAANAVLMSGRIYEELENKQQARKQYERCLELSGFEYELSIHQKAEAALLRVKGSK